ncbi:MAG: hypothetical protein H7Z73_03115 [Candidatus Saccharibacteria bacterium]|nr:hypothetical protein [Moraxellaceae bacterium]
MNAPMNTDLADLIFQISENSIPNSSVQGITTTIKKVDVLRYYRETKQAFINLSGLLISQTGGKFYIFNLRGELVRIDRIQV